MQNMSSYRWNVQVDDGTESKKKKRVWCKIKFKLKILEKNFLPSDIFDTKQDVN